MTTPVHLPRVTFRDIEDMRREVRRYGRDWADTQFWPGSHIIGELFGGRAFLTIETCDHYTVRVVSQSLTGLTLCHVTIGDAWCIDNRADADRLATAVGDLHAAGFMPAYLSGADSDRIAELAGYPAEWRNVRRDDGVTRYTS